MTFDFGASSGIAIVASYENGKLGMKEVHRFTNDPVMVNGVLYWDILRLFHEIKHGIVAAKLDGGFDATGIDTWGVDYGIIDVVGNLAENPVCYRDTNANGIEEEVYKIISEKDLYLRTGLQYQPFNSLFNTVKITAEKDFVYISCGTWSLFGTVLADPILKKEAMEAQYTNEGGYDDTIIFLKNIMGMWIFQETCRQWKREGKEFNYKTFDDAAAAAKPYVSFINPDDPVFSPFGNMPKRIKDFCTKTGQTVPETDGEICRCIYQSLAMKYRQSLEYLEKLQVSPTTEFIW